jgi:mono/diheme cytochrome c family protein
VTPLRGLVVAILLLVVLTAAYLAWAWAPELPASATPAREALAPTLVARGAALAAVGNCIVCHTAIGGKAFAGGRPLRTPFGTVFATNITPDPASGIGRWSEAAFVRAMREGVDREGRHLYPVFPYEHFRLMTDDDLRALYAYLVTREPVVAQAPRNRLRFPFNLRPLLAAWKARYLAHGQVPQDPARDAAWQRGAYLVTAVAHCGACHTPRNRLGAERWGESFAGGEAEGWDAPALGAASPAPTAWSADDLARYLRGGLPPHHGVAAGPMTPVVRSLADAQDPDVQAIVAYVAALPARPGRVAPAASAVAPSAEDPGRALYDGTCAGCHDAGRDAPDGALPLADSTLTRLPTPRNLFRVILHGLAPADGQRGVTMPGFAGALTDGQAGDLAQHLRARFGKLAPWPDVAGPLRAVARTPDERAVSGGP